jgi:hypothetical protein
MPGGHPRREADLLRPEPRQHPRRSGFVGRLAKQYHWSSVVLVTTPPQDTRARLLMGRCLGGSVYVTTASLPLGSWPYQIAYGWGALVKALVVNRAC